MKRAGWDWKNPDVDGEFRRRVAALERIRAKPEFIPKLKEYYRDNPAEFIDDWGVTLDPRNIERGLPSLLPFVLTPKQREWIEWLVARWRGSERGLTEKSRDAGASWVAMSLSCTLCLHFRGMAIGFGSRKEEYVDKIGSPKALFEKGRTFMQYLPREFRGGFDLKKSAPHMRLLFPESESAITGECGDEIGRGDRTAIYFVDESAHLEHPELAEASLSQTTNCRQDVSTPKGMANPFAQKRHSGTVPVFTFGWRDDPRKDDAWYAKQCATLDPVTVAQEIDISYTASVEGVVIPNAWVQAAIDAHVKLGFTPTGEALGALDVADEGRDKNAFAGRRGVVLEHIEQWSGKGDDIFGTVERAFSLCDARAYDSFHYDADGLGAGVRGDARVINERRRAQDGKMLRADPFRGSGELWQPEGEMVEKRKNRDFFANLKAQSWWALRLRFQRTYRAVVEGAPDVDCDEIISLDSRLPELSALARELSQPTFSVNGAGKILIDKAPDGAKSPNLADAVMIVFSPGRRRMTISEDALRELLLA